MILGIFPPHGAPRRTPARTLWRYRTALGGVVLAAWAAACGGAQRAAVRPGEAGIASLTIKAAPGTTLTIDTDELRDGLALERARRAGEPFERYLVKLDTERLRGYYVHRGYFRAQVISDVQRPERTRRAPRDEAATPGTAPAEPGASTAEPGAEPAEPGTPSTEPGARPGGRTDADRERRAREPRLVHIAFEINEGPRAKLTRVEIAGLPKDAGVTTDELRALIPLKDGQPFNYDEYDRAKPALVAALERVGYAYAELDASVAADVVTDEAIIRIELKPGPLCTFGAITLNGVDGDLAEAARDRVRAREGQRYSSTLLADTQTALYEMNRFALVRIEPDLAEEHAEVPVAITVVQSTRHELRLGGGTGLSPETYEIRARAGYSVAGFPRPLMTTRLDARPALVRLRDSARTKPRIQLSAALERMDLFRPFMRGDAEATLQYVTSEAYTSVGPGFRLGLQTPLRRKRVLLYGGWQIQYLTFSEIDPAIDADLQAALAIDRPNRIGHFEQRVALDLRDDPVAPRKGVYAELYAEQGTVAAGGAFEYLRFVPELRGYVPLGAVVLALRTRIGTTTGAIPATHRFFGGGANSQRGFTERRLAPFAVGVDSEGATYEVAYGGGALAEVGAELRRRLGSIRTFEIGGVVFLDGADVTERLGDIDPGLLHWAAGVGLRIPTIIGAVRFDVGYRLNRRGDGDPRPGEAFAYHISIGEAF